MSETHGDWKLMLASNGPQVHEHRYIIEEKDVAHCWMRWCNVIPRIITACLEQP